MRDYLVVVRAGDQSLHPQWLSSDHRSWDIVVSYYGNVPDRVEGPYELLHLCKGTKWQGICDLLHCHPGLFAGYRYIWFPDDDLLANGTTIDAFFAIADQLNLTIAQPALTPDSHISWDITRQVAGLTARLTDFVEIMAPCFRGDCLALFSQHFADNSSGWGYEWLWWAIARIHGIDRLGIVDQTPVRHTRPVGSEGHGGSQGSPAAELQALLLQHGLKQTTPRVLGLIPSDIAQQTVHEDAAGG